MSAKCVLIYSVGPVTDEVKKAAAAAAGEGAKVCYRNPVMFAGADPMATKAVVFGDYPDVGDAYSELEPSVPVEEKDEGKDEGKEAPEPPKPKPAAPPPPQEPKKPK